MKNIHKVYSYFTSTSKNLPDFLIIGAQKAGTTSLYNYLAQHPKIQPSIFRKEINYFEKRYYRKSLRWYQSQFSPSTPGLLNFEASTNYLFYPWAAKRVFETLPKSKIIILLREPKQRAWSQYKHQIRSKEEQLEFPEALERELNLIDAEEEKILANPKYFSKSFRNYSYLKRGLYCKQIQNWLQYFKIEQFFIYSSENFYKDPKKTCYEIFDFLEIERFPVDVSSKHNQSDTKQLPPEKTLELMDDYFREPNQMLYELLSQSFEWDMVN